MDKSKEQNRTARSEASFRRTMPSPKDIFEKRASATSASGFQTDIRVEIAELEARAMRKPSAESSTPTSRTGLSILEEEALSKRRLMEPAVEVIARTRVEISPKSHSTTTSRKQQVLHGSPAIGAMHSLRELDDRLAYKTGIVIHKQEGDRSPPKEERKESFRMRDSLAKLTGIPADAIGAALEKTCPITSLDHKRDGEQGMPHSDLEFGGDEASKLAVAVAIKEEDDNKFILAAIEFDPEGKPPILRNRRFRLYCLLACTLVVVMIAGIVGLLTQQKKEYITFETPTEAPTRPGSNGILDQLELIVGTEVLKDPSGPHYRAKEWLINEDPMQLSPQDANLVQRYLLAVIYFKFREKGSWLSCGAPTEEEPDDFCLFQKLINIFPREYRSVASYRWLSGNHECSWAGLFCDEFFQLRTIDLTGQDISAELPIEFTYFPFLQGIGLSWNKFHGTLPPQYGDMPHLLNFEMHYNELTGNIPKAWARAKNLQLFNVAANQISGSIPKELGDMSNLKGLFVFENILSGTFPSELCKLSLLSTYLMSAFYRRFKHLLTYYLVAYARLQRNFISGTMPTEIGQLSPREFWSHRMPIEGPIPSEIGHMKGVLDLRIHGTSLSGTIPEELWQLTHLFRLDLYNTNISGTLSSNVAQLTDLAFLRLRNAGMTGTLPMELANMTELSKVWLDGNEFVGTIPQQLCNQEGLEELAADCLPSSGTTVPQLQCVCCDVCCDHATGICDEQVGS